MKQAQKPKKKISLPADTEGLPVGPVKKKDRKLDLTDELRLFLDNEITFDSIKYILLRMQGPISFDKVKNSVLSIYAIEEWVKIYNKHDFLIIIANKKDYPLKFFLNSFGINKLCWFVKCDEEPSNLKYKVIHNIYCWLCENLDKCFIIKCNNEI